MILFQNLIILFMCGRDTQTIILFYRIFESTGYWISEDCMALFPPDTQKMSVTPILLCQVHAAQPK